MPSSKCVLPQPCGPYTTSGVSAPGRSAADCAEACAKRLQAPTTNESSVANRRRGAPCPFASPADKLVAAFGAELAPSENNVLPAKAGQFCEPNGLTCLASPGALHGLSCARPSPEPQFRLLGCCDAANASSTRNSTATTFPRTLLADSSRTGR